jgi:hypothetical protein
MVTTFLVSFHLKSWDGLHHPHRPTEYDAGIVVVLSAVQNSHSYRDRDDALLHIQEFLENIYNCQRLHSDIWRLPRSKLLLTQARRQ